MSSESQSGSKSLVKYDLVEINPRHYLKLMKCGSINKNDSNSNIVFVIIPGNPGVIEFYEHFALELHNTTKHPVIGLSHTGHFYHDENSSDLKSDLNSFVGCWEPIDLKRQVEDKLKFIQEHLVKTESNNTNNTTKYVFIGHSIGCYIILQMLERLDSDFKQRCIQRTIHLFPTIERMAETPNGKWLHFSTKFLLWLIYMLAFFICSVLPIRMQKYLIDICFTKRHANNKPHSELVQNVDEIVFRMSTNYATIRSCLHMGKDEMKHVKELNEQTLFHDDHAHLLLFYYGQTDKWCPIDYYLSMKQRIDTFISKKNKKNNIEEENKLQPILLLDEHCLDHAFVIYKNQCLILIEKIAQWIK